MNLLARGAVVGGFGLLMAGGIVVLCGVVLTRAALSHLREPW